MSEVKSENRAKRRIVGKVVSSKADKTVTVLVERRVRHPLYGKYVKKSTRLHAHDEENACHEGDRVAIVETRPISRSKCFRLEAILESASALQQKEASTSGSGV